MEKGFNNENVVRVSYEIGQLVGHRLNYDKVGIVLDVRITLRGNIVDYYVAFADHTDWYSENELIDSDEMNGIHSSDEYVNYSLTYGKIGDA